MGITRLKRKARRNKKTSATRKNSIKQLSAQPVLKNIDKEAAKAAFAPVMEEKKPKAKAKKMEETTAEVVEAVVEETVKTEEVETPKAKAEEVESVEEKAPEEGQKEG
jgi:Spy/CpxP family protein refolding chaperone